MKRTSVCRTVLSEVQSNVFQSSTTIRYDYYGKIRIRTWCDDSPHVEKIIFWFIVNSFLFSMTLYCIGNCSNEANEMFRKIWTMLPVIVCMYHRWVARGHLVPTWWKMGVWVQFVCMDLVLHAFILLFCCIWYDEQYRHEQCTQKWEQIQKT